MKSTASQKQKFESKVLIQNPLKGKITFCYEKHHDFRIQKVVEMTNQVGFERTVQRFIKWLPILSCVWILNRMVEFLSKSDHCNWNW